MAMQFQSPAKLCVNYVRGRRIVISYQRIPDHLERGVEHFSYGSSNLKCIPLETSARHPYWHVPH